MRTIAHAISFVFHPLLVMTYAAILIAFINPYLFGVHHATDEQIIVKYILPVIAYTFVVPICFSVMMLFLGFIDSIEMKTRQERIAPLIGVMTFYFLMSYTFYKNPEIPNACTIFMMGSSMALAVAFFINNFSKISLHALGMGGLLGMVVITMLYFSYGNFTIGNISMSMNFLLMLVIIITGLVGTSRLILDAHEPMDLYGGFFIGFGTQFLAFTILS